MNREDSENRPESPKKKMRPSSTTNPDSCDSNSINVSSSLQNGQVQTNGYGLAPTRKFRNRRPDTEPSSSSESTLDPNDNRRDVSGQTNEQEEEVSSSENASQNNTSPPASEGNADSAGAINPLSGEGLLYADCSDELLSSEAEKK